MSGEPVGRSHSASIPVQVTIFGFCHSRTYVVCTSHSVTNRNTNRILYAYACSLDSAYVGQIDRAD